MRSVLNKRAQLKIQQMAIMIVAITLFFLLVLMFYLSIKMTSLREQAVELNREKAVGLVTKIASSPEFSFEGASRGVDIDKVMVLKEKTEYRDFWGVDGIIIEKLYPEAADAECTKSNYPNCNRILLFTDGRGEFVHSYISLCRKQSIEGRTIYDECELAILKLGVKETENEE